MTEDRGTMFKRIYNLLLPEEHKTAASAVVAVFLSVLLDFAGLAVLLPVLYFLLEKGENHRAALLFCLLAITVILVKCIVATALTRYQNRFLLSLYKRLSLSLYASSYHRGLLFIRRQGINRLGYEINGICYAFSQSLLAPLVRMAGDSLLILLILLVLLLYAPFTAIVLSVSFLPFISVYIMVIRKRVKLYGDREQTAKREQWRITADTFGGYTELQVNNAFPRFRSSFMEGLEEISRNRLNMDTFLRLPMFLSELSAITGLTLMTASGSGDVKVLVGIFAVAAFRLLPAMRSILSGWTQIRNAAGCLDILEEGLENTPIKTEGKGKELVWEKEITLSHLYYSYPEGEKVFTDFSCTIGKGEYVGFIGYSGVGKSTLFNLLLGLLVPDKGEIIIDGTPLTATLRPAWLQQVGYVPQEVFIFDGTLAENVALGTEIPDKERIIRILEQVCLDSWLKTLPQGIDCPLGERGGRLSGGQKQRIGIARALYRDINILLLDEATSALDNETEKEVNNTLYALRKRFTSLTILSIAHRESSLVYCDRIIRLK